MEDPQAPEPLSLRGVLYVHIVESPNAEDLLDGRTEGAVLQESLQIAGIPNSYNLVTNRATFETAMSERVRAGMASFNAHPLLHFSMHGDQRGVGLTSGELITWPELANYIRGLEPITGWGLIVCMSSCYGAFARQMSLTSARPPYYILLGHPGNVDWADAAVGFTALYHRLFKGVPHFYDAVNAMREASGDSRFDHGSALEDQAAWRQHVNHLLEPGKKG